MLAYCVLSSQMHLPPSSVLHVPWLARMLLGLANRKFPDSLSRAACASAFTPCCFACGSGMVDSLLDTLSFSTTVLPACHCVLHLCLFGCTTGAAHAPVTSTHQHAMLKLALLHPPVPLAHHHPVLYVVPHASVLWLIPFVDDVKPHMFASTALSLTTPCHPDACCPPQHPYQSDLSLQTSAHSLMSPASSSPKLQCPSHCF